MNEMTVGTRFRPVLADPSIVNPSKVERVVLLTGKLYYDLVKARATQEGLSDKIAFVRLEELSPFPFHELKAVLEKYGSVKDLVWVQEEPRNQGAWTFVGGRIQEVIKQSKKEGKLQALRHSEVRYVGRKEDAVPAPGIARLYAAQQKRVIDSVFEGL